MSRKTSDDIHTTRKREFSEFQDQTHKARDLSERDRDFYDGIQWTDEEIRDLNDRNQPVVTHNRIAPKINYILGTEIRTRIDPRAYPRTQKHEDDAIVATDGLRFLADREQFDQVRSDVMESLCVEGYGGCILETEIEPKIEPVAQYQSAPRSVEGGVAQTQVGVSRVEKQVEIRLRMVSWDRIFYDPHSRKPDFSDGIYCGVVVWRDYDEVVLDPQYAGREDILTATKNESAGEGGASTDDRPKKWYDSSRNRIQVIEHYYRLGAVWSVCHWVWGGLLFDPQEVRLVDEKGKNWCPLVMTSAFVNRENERYGVVRCMISPQEEINKRRSKALHLLTMRQVLAEEGAVPSPMEAQQELAKPDGWVSVTPGALKDGRFQLGQTADLAQGQFQLLQEAKGEIDTVGPHAALVAADQRQMSGRAFMARQQAGSMEIEPVFDNLRHWELRMFRCMWWMVRQFWTDERWFRVRDDEEHKGFRFVGINQRMTRGERVMELIKKQVPPESAIEQVAGPAGVQGYQQAMQQTGQQMQQAQQMAQQAEQTGQQVPPEMQQLQQMPPEALQQLVQQQALQTVLQHPLAQQEFTVNDIAQLDIDIVLDSTPDTAIVEHEEFQELIGLAQSGTLQVTPDVLQMIIEASNLRNKRKLLAMLNKTDPMQEQIQQQQIQLRMGQMQAALQKLQADAAKSGAQAAKTQAETEQTVPAQAQKDQALAAKAVAEAGQKTVPEMGRL